MKLVKMSLAAAMLMGASAFAIENVKVEGAANLFYSTTDDNTPDQSLFDKESSAGQASLKLGTTADLTEGVSAGATLYAISTLGLEGTLVNNVWEMGTDSEYWFGEAWLAGTAGKTTAKVGRMELDTPLAFSEGWSVAPNTFEAAVLINTDLPDTTLVGAYVGKHNSGGNVAGIGAILNEIDSVSDTAFNKLYNGVYAVGAINNSFKPLTAQAWYYDLQGVAKAYWLQADLACEKVEGLSAGLQYASINPNAAGADTTTGYAAMLGYAVEDVVSLSAAYSSVDDEGAVAIRNTSTDFESKLYTEKWWNFGLVGDIGSDSYSFTAEGSAGNVDLFAGFYNSTIEPKGGTETELTEIAITAAKSYGPLDATLAYINADFSDAADSTNDWDSDTVQVYLTYNF